MDAMMVFLPSVDGYNPPPCVFGAIFGVDGYAPNPPGFCAPVGICSSGTGTWKAEKKSTPGEKDDREMGMSDRCNTRNTRNRLLVVC